MYDYVKIGGTVWNITRHALAAFGFAERAKIRTGLLSITHFDISAW